VYMIKIEAPSKCPSCGGIITTVKDQLYCLSEDCGDKQYKVVEHFCSTMKIKGLGPANIKKLDIRNIEEIYAIDMPEGKTWENIAAEIEKSKSASLNQVLPALSIPLVGQTASNKLATVVDSLQEVTFEICKEAGLGDKASNNIMEFLSTFDYSLPFNYKFNRTTSGSNGIVCITGKLTSFKNKAEAAKILEAKGYSVRPNLTKEVTILVNESGSETAKTIKARESGVIIVTNLKQYLGE
jgi:NAD-dependent DNA ligase